MPGSDPRDFTIGVEEEYQLVANATGELRSRARDVLAADWAGVIHAEAHETMLEVGTEVWRDGEALRAELLRLRLQVASAAAAEGLRVIAAGIHPFSLWQSQLMTRGERFDVIRERYARVVRTEQVFGMHIHVAIPGAYDRIDVLRSVRWFTPHLLALSCSSPIYEGKDTGFASYRSILWRRLPLTGPFPGVGSEEEYARFSAMLVDSGAAMDHGTIYWSIRPHPKYPTIEYRVTDTCPRVDDAVAIAAFARALTVAVATGRLEAPTTRLGGGAEVAVIAANEWTIARYGLDGTVMNPRLEGGIQRIRDSIEELLEVLRPIAAELGDAAALAGIEKILERGNTADRMRQMVPHCADLPVLIDWLEGETLLGTGIDRRAVPRVTDQATSATLLTDHSS